MFPCLLVDRSVGCSLPHWSVSGCRRKSLHWRRTPRRRRSTDRWTRKQDGSVRWMVVSKEKTVIQRSPVSRVNSLSIIELLATDFIIAVSGCFVRVKGKRTRLTLFLLLAFEPLFYLLARSLGIFSQLSPIDFSFVLSK